MSDLYRSARSFGGRALRSVRRRAGSTARRAHGVARRAGESTAQAADTVSWSVASRRGRTGRFRLETLVGTPDTDAIPVIVCLWNRATRIDDILAQLDAQKSPRRVRLLLWNNNAADDAFYRARIAAFRPTGALASVEYVLSPRNVGGMGRFYLARRLLGLGYSGHFITLDDDQDVTPDFVTSLLGYAAPREFAGFWAWNYIDSHWNRTPTPPGAIADYAGTGGAICDIEIVRSSRFFTELPRRYAFLEDQWLCGYARSLGWTVRKADVDITFVLHETNQFPQLAALKDEFREYLINRNAMS